MSISPASKYCRNLDQHPVIQEVDILPISELAVEFQEVAKKLSEFQEVAKKLSSRRLHTVSMMTIPKSPRFKSRASQMTSELLTGAEVPELGCVVNESVLECALTDVRQIAGFPIRPKMIGAQKDRFQEFQKCVASQR
eukprot:3240272-Karenia_brevis.AAC.1